MEPGTATDGGGEPSQGEVAAPAPKPVKSAPSPFPKTSPKDGKPLPKIVATRPAEVAEAVADARTTQLEWADRPVRERADIVEKLKRQILGRASELAEIISRESGKPIEEALLGDVLPVADLVDYWASSIEELLQSAPVDLDPVTFRAKVGKIVREPRGVVALITPWNFPLSIPLRSLVPALVAGNAVILKPSEMAARTGSLLGSICAEVLPKGLVTVVQGGADVGAALVDAGVDLVVFTGGVAAGKKVAVACAERLIPCSLELGGKDAAIVLADANLERTARGLVWGAFSNAGQSCASIERAYVERPIADALIARIVELTEELRLGEDIGPLASKAQAKIVRDQLEKAIEQGAELITGGTPEEEDSLAFPPTVLKLTDEDTPLMQDETFGPILPIVIVEDEAEAIERANSSRFGLTASIWTRRIARANELARVLGTGIVTINNHGFTAAVPGAPWTGIGESGYGVTGSPHALAELTRPRFILEDRSLFRREIWWYPYTPTLRALAFSLIRARGGAGFFGRIGAFFQATIGFLKRVFGG